MCRCYVTFGKMPLFKVVVNIIFLSVWAASNASLYNGCQPFHVAFIHKRKKTTDINLHTTNFIQWHLQENTEYDENGSKKNRFGAGLLNHQLDVFNFFSAYFFGTKTHIMRAQKCPLYPSKVFLWWKIFCMKSANLWKKYRFCQVNLCEILLLSWSCRKKTFEFFFSELHEIES